MKTSQPMPKKMPPANESRRAWPSPMRAKCGPASEAGALPKREPGVHEPVNAWRRVQGKARRGLRSNDVANLGPGARVALFGAAAGGAPFSGVWGARDNGCRQYPASKETVERRRDRLLRAATGARGRVWRGGAAAV
jgi:hypothetical protein